MRWYYEETTVVYRPRQRQHQPKKSDPNGHLYGWVIILSIAAGGVTGGWGGAAIGFCLASALCYYVLGGKNHV